MKRICVLTVVIVLGLFLVAYSETDALDPGAVSIDTMGLPFSWQANIVEAMPYDDSQPPGPMGLPEHMQINFGVTNSVDVQFGDYGQ